MAIFVSLINWTEQGIKNFRDTPKRAAAFEELVKKRGGRVVGLYWTLGDYDIVAITEAPDAETYTAIALELGALGNLRTQTLRGFSVEEIERIIEKTG